MIHIFVNGKLKIFMFFKYLLLYMKNIKQLLILLILFITSYSFTIIIIDLYFKQNYLYCNK